MRDLRARLRRALGQPEARIPLPAWPPQRCGPGAPRPKSVYLREDRILAKLPLLHHILTAADSAVVITGASASAARPVPPSPEEVTDHLRASALILRYDSRTRTLETGSEHPVRITI